MATKKRDASQDAAEEVIDMLVEMRNRAHESWVEELGDIERNAGHSSWVDLADRLIELVAHIRAGAPLERT